MKQYIVLFVALLMLIKPLWPVAEYVMNYDYIVNVLCENKDKPQMHCDGKCFLSKQLAKESEKSDKNPFRENRSMSEIQPMVYFQPFFKLDFRSDAQNKALDNFDTSQGLISLLFTSDISHPPELA